MIRPYSQDMDGLEVEGWHRARGMELPCSMRWGYVISGVLFVSLTPLGDRRWWVEDLISNPDLRPHESWQGAKELVSWVAKAAQKQDKIALMSSDVPGVQKFLTRFVGATDTVSAIWRIE